MVCERKHIFTLKNVDNIVNEVFVYKGKFYPY